MIIGLMVIAVGPTRARPP